MTQTSTMTTQARYPIVTILLHWLMALLFALILTTACIFAFSEGDWNLIKQYMGLHKSVGFILFVLILVRIVWFAISFKKRPQPLNALSKYTHLALYFFMFATPFIAMLRQFGSGQAFNVFGLSIISANPERKIEFFTKTLGAFHSYFGWILFALVALHLAGLVLHLIQGDNSVLKRVSLR